MKKYTAFIYVTVILALVLTGCQAKPAALSNQQVMDVTDNILKALGSGDYQAFTRDFSPTMLDAFSESKYNDLQTMLQGTSGAYKSCAEPTLSNSNEYAIYQFVCEFEKEKVVVKVVFAIDGNLVDGLFFDSTNLRNLSK
jgi:hypothetical protein